jgi:hypothetical protein
MPETITITVNKDDLERLAETEALLTMLHTIISTPSALLLFSLDDLAATLNIAAANILKVVSTTVGADT